MAQSIWWVLFTLRKKKLLAKPPGEPEVKIRKLVKKTSHSRSVNKKTIIYTSEAFPAAVASQASKSSDLHTVEIIWFSKKKDCSWIKNDLSYYVFNR